MTSPYILRKATHADIPALHDLHRAALLELAGEHYTARQVEGFLADFRTVDPDLIGDGTYFVIEHKGRIAASGGWTIRTPAYAQDVAARHQANHARATMRAIFTAPGHARRGLASKIMTIAEEQAVILGMAERLELSATLSGLRLYARLGYHPTDAKTVRLSNGETFSWIDMVKTICPQTSVSKVEAPSKNDHLFQNTAQIPVGQLSQQPIAQQAA